MPRKCIRRNRKRVIESMSHHWDIISCSSSSQSNQICLIYSHQDYIVLSPIQISWNFRKLQPFPAHVSWHPRKLKILVQVRAIQISSWVKDPSLQDGWFGQGDSWSEGQLQTFQALFSRPAAFDPYVQENSFSPVHYSVIVSVLSVDCDFFNLNFILLV